MKNVSALTKEISELFKNNNHISFISHFAYQRKINVAVYKDFFNNVKPDRIENRIEDDSSYKFTLSKKHGEYTVEFTCFFSEEEFKEWSREFSKEAWQDAKI